MADCFSRVLGACLADSFRDQGVIGAECVPEQEQEEMVEERLTGITEATAPHSGWLLAQPADLSLVVGPEQCQEATVLGTVGEQVCVEGSLSQGLG